MLELFLILRIIEERHRRAAQAHEESQRSADQYSGQGPAQVTARRRAFSRNVLRALRAIRYIPTPRLGEQAKEASRTRVLNVDRRIGWLKTAGTALRPAHVVSADFEVVWAVVGNGRAPGRPMNNWSWC